MKSCLRCGIPNPATEQRCRQCGQPLATGPLRPEESTVRWAGGLPARDRQPGQPISVDDLFGAKNRLIVGRALDCDYRLDHPTISRHHALLERLPEGLRLRDLDSVNGVLIGGRRITEPVFLKEQERVGIGPYLFCLNGSMVHSLDNSLSLRLEARHLEKVVPGARRKTLKLLDDINLAVEPGEFVSLLGPSGSGKSTLMDCLNGRRPATGGRVLANGEDFYLHFDSFRQSLGYVPQRDIVHTQLTVYRALYYTARLRLPTDTSPGELVTRIDEVLRLMELETHQDTLIANLSGGQIKRVSLGAELLARPCLLFIDEATSGLDAGTEARMMLLFRHLADEGKSVVCITHNVENVDCCNLILMLARGKLVFYGPPGEARTYFKVSRFNQIYDCLAAKEPDTWQKEFSACSLHHEFVEKRLRPVAEEKDAGQPVNSPRRFLSLPGFQYSSALLYLQPASPLAPARPRRPPLWHQFHVLTARYLELLWGDKRGLRLLILQAPVVALFILLGFINKPYQDQILAPRKLTEFERIALEMVQPTVERADPNGKATELLRGLIQSNGPVVPYKVIIDPRFTYVLLFMLVITILWFGSNNAAKEIVKEEAIYGRERSVNLGILPYLASKFLVLSLISALQILVVMVMVYGTLEVLQATLGQDMPPSEYLLNFPAQFGILVLLSMTGVALGLLLSSSVATADRANTLLPYVLIPQIILGGGILPVKTEPLHLIAVLLSPAYWAFRAVRRGATDLPPDLPFAMDYNDSVWLSAAALTIQMIVLLLLTTWFLRRKDVRKA